MKSEEKFTTFQKTRPTALEPVILLLKYDTDTYKMTGFQAFAHLHIPSQIKTGEPPSMKWYKSEELGPTPHTFTNKINK